MNDAQRPLPEKLGKYEVRREVGRGGMGIVYEGFDPVIGRRVALKTFITDYFDATQSDNLLTRLRREAQAAGRLNHRNIIAVYDYGEDIVKDPDGTDATTAYIAMEFVEGRSLESYFEAHERFPMGEIQRIMGELLDALQYSHDHGVVHRDIKPANVILLNDGTVKVADFGVARLESSTLTQVGTVLGSPSYMSPEQFMGQTVDGRSDLYSAGVVLYQLLTAEIPFTGAFTTIMHRVLHENAPPPCALNVQVPKGFDEVLRRAMAKRPDERYQSASEFQQAIVAATSASPAPPADAAMAGSETLVRPAGSAGGAAPEGAFGAAVSGQGVPSTGALGKEASGTGVPVKGALRPAVLFTVLGLLAAGAAAAYFVVWPRFNEPSGPAAGGPLGRAPPLTAQSSGADATPLGRAPEAFANGDSAVISAVGIAAPADAGAGRDGAAHAVWADARQQLVAKAAALYVQPSSLNANYAVVRTKLLARSDDFIKTVLNQGAPQTSPDGVTFGIMRAAVSVRDVQKTLNQISHDERVDFIRNNGDPKIAVSVRTWNPDAEAATGPQPSAVAENILKEHIHSFGFAVVDEEHAKPPADFRVEGEVRFKKLAAKLPASGLTIEKVVLTSWTVKAVDAKSGQEIYHNTTIPEKQSWATQELALQDVGHLIGAEFSQSFFLKYFDFKPKNTRLRFSGLPPDAANAVLDQINGNLIVLNAALDTGAGGDVVIDAQLSAGTSSLSDLVQQSLLAPLNKKMGANCFTLLAGDQTTELHIAFDPACTAAAAMSQLKTAPREALAAAHGTSL
jgi:eukaryotic-like serine/threonine-protein kinase